ncbi:thioredoxin [bacterium]|nr:thioredoxin [bacterium]
MKLLKFEAEWCGPCKTMNSIIKNLQSKNKINIEITPVNIDEAFDMVKYWKVTSVPTLILIKDENAEIATEIRRHTGVLKETELIEFIKND